jgi:hypothetical protein
MLLPLYNVVQTSASGLFRHQLGVVLVLIVACASVFALFTQLAKNTRPGETAPSPATTAQTSITATPITATSPANVVSIPYSPYRGTLVLNDPMRDDSQGYNWDSNPTSFGTCTFTGGAYQVAATSIGTYHRCIAENTNFSNFIHEVELTISTGDCGGILFRADASLYHYYYFRICQNGSYSLWLYTQSGVETRHFIQSTSPVITTEYGQSNLIAVVANNHYLALYVNHQLIKSTNDNTFSQAQIGVAADSVNSPTEVVFRNAKVWRL